MIRFAFLELGIGKETTQDVGKICLTVKVFRNYFSDSFCQLNTSPYEIFCY
jgi:hypothetical protein